MTIKPNYSIVREDESIIILRDLGPWSKYLTITNGAEEVIEELNALGRLTNKKRVLYYDSDGFLDEIAHQDGKFRGFKCCL